MCKVTMEELRRRCKEKKGKLPLRAKPERIEFSPEVLRKHDRITIIQERTKKILDIDDIDIF